MLASDLRVSLIASLAPEDRASLLAQLTDGEVDQLLHDWRFFAREEQLAPDGDWQFWVFLAGRGAGKMVADTTPIATPTGWTTMGDLKVGDEVFDESGRRCKVTAKFSPKVDEQYRLTFADGSEIDACGDHQWMTWTHAERKAFLRSPYEDTTKFPDNWPRWRLSRMLGWQVTREQVEAGARLRNGGMTERAVESVIGISRQILRKYMNAGGFVARVPVVHSDAPGPQVRTTKEIVETLTQGKHGDLNHCVPCCAPLDLPDIDLPIPPYTLGMWLGDGSSGGGSFTSHEDDMPLTREMIEADGIQTTKQSHAQQFGTIGLTVLLRSEGLLHNKHVPAAYLRASARQRTALLRGLMDSDGNHEGGNKVAFVNTNRRLVDAVEELVHSLGMKATITTGIGKFNGKVGKQYWRVNFRPVAINPFSLPRKAAKLSFSGNQSLRSCHRMIVSARRINPVAMSCITVNSPNSMYLVGKAMIPTHNTKAGSQWVREKVKGGFGRLHLIAPTTRDTRDVMIEGDSGVLSSAWASDRDHRGNLIGRPVYQPSMRRLTWENGAIATAFSAEEPDRLRGPQCDALWADEVAAWNNGEPDDAWDMALFGLRLGENPQGLVTTTPRPIPLLRELIKNRNTVTTKSHTNANRANLAASFLSSIVSKYEGTRLGRQELAGELIEEAEGALWTRDLIERCRTNVTPDLTRIVVSIDPPASHTGVSALCGIVVAARGTDQRGYVMADHSGRMSPNEWGSRAINAFDAWKADAIVIETNQGGDMAEHVIRTVRPMAPVIRVHASKGKQARAEPVASLYERGMISHVGPFVELEDQLCTWEPLSGHPSPDRLDALVWAFDQLMVSARKRQLLFG